MFQKYILFLFSFNTFISFFYRKCITSNVTYMERVKDGKHSWKSMKIKKRLNLGISSSPGSTEIIGAKLEKYVLLNLLAGGGGLYTLVNFWRAIFGLKTFKVKI